MHDESNLEFVNTAVMRRSMDGRIEFWNPCAEDLYGWKKEEARGQVSHDLLHTQFPKPLQEIESELVRNGQWEGKLVHTARDGHHLIVDSWWTFDSEGLVEINRPSPNLVADLETASREIAKQESVPRSRSSKVDNLLQTISSTVLAVGAFLCLVIASYAFTKPFNDAIDQILYGFGPLGLAVVLVASLKLKPSHRINLAIFCISLTASVYGMEIFLHWWLNSAPLSPLILQLDRSADRQEEAIRLSKKFGVPIDPRTALEVLADLNKNGLGTIPFVSPSNNLFVEQDGYRKSVINVGGAEVIPLAAISQKPTLLCNENGQWITYKSDVHGFNNPDKDIWKSSSVDIVAVGDSFTQGYCVPPDKSFMGLIRQKYPKTLNLGIAGDGPLMELATMREYLDKIQSKIVLWFYCEDNDLVELQGERRTALLPLYLQSDFKQNLVPRQAAIDAAMTKDILRQKALEQEAETRRRQPYITAEFADLLKLSMLRSTLRLTPTAPREITKLKDMEGPNLDFFAQVLAQAKSRVDASHGKMVFVYLPSWARYAKIFLTANDNLLQEMRQRARVLSIVNSLRIPIVDIGELFEAQEDPLLLFPFREPGHYNEIGHRLVADEVLKTLSSKHS
jgi:hypothetical protein